MYLRKEDTTSTISVQILTLSFAKFCHQQKYRQIIHFSCQTVNFLSSEIVLTVVSSQSESEKSY